MNEKISDGCNTCTLERLLKPTEVADLLNISRSFAYQLLQTGAIPSVRLCRVRRVRPQDLADYIDANTTGGDSNS